MDMREEFREQYYDRLVFHLMEHAAISKETAEKVIQVIGEFWGTRPTAVKMAAEELREA